MVRVAVIFSNKGGISDVGRFVCSELVARSITDFVPICIGARSDGPGFGLSVSEAGFDDKVSVETMLENTKNLTISRVYTDEADFNSSQNQLNELLSGVDTVLASFGSRQIGFTRYNATAGKLLLTAIQNNNCSRLLLMSTVSLGTDFLPFYNIGKAIMKLLFYTVAKDARKDLVSMESLFSSENLKKENIELDVVIVRPMGIGPEVKPKGYYETLSKESKNKGKNMQLQIAKPDVATFFVDEALNPTFHSEEVTVGWF